jgi:hypothetical protein
MKLIAEVGQVLRPGIHRVASVDSEGDLAPVSVLPAPQRVEIELTGGTTDPCFLLRYTDAGEFCGDTWHENLESAYAQAESEYGLSPEEFKREGV